LGLVPTIGLHKAYNRNWNGIHLSITKYAMVFKWNLTSASLHIQLWFMKCSQGTWELINIDWLSPTTNILSDITAHIVQSVKRTFLLIQTPYLGPLSKLKMCIATEKVFMCQSYCWVIFI
jgi:hypothetical protein